MQDKIKKRLIEKSRDIGKEGFDNESGYGLIDGEFLEEAFTEEPVEEKKSLLWPLVITVVVVTLIYLFAFA